MIKAFAVSVVLAVVAMFAMFRAPAGLTDPMGTLLRTAAAVAFLAFLGRVVGVAPHRRPPRPSATRVIVLIVATVTIQVLAIWFSPDWSIALAVWYITLFLGGLLLNRWCDAPERYAIFVAAFEVFLASLILMALAAAAPAQQDLGPNTVMIAIWRNVTRIAGNPGDAAWTWLAWRIADRSRAPEAKRPKIPPPRAMKPFAPGPRADA